MRGVCLFKLPALQTPPWMHGVCWVAWDAVCPLWGSQPLDLVSGLSPRCVLWSCSGLLWRPSGLLFRSGLLLGIAGGTYLHQWGPALSRLPALRGGHPPPESRSGLRVARPCQWACCPGARPLWGARTGPCLGPPPPLPSSRTPRARVTEGLLPEPDMPRLRCEALPWGFFRSCQFPRSWQKQSGQRTKNNSLTQGKGGASRAVGPGGLSCGQSRGEWGSQPAGPSGSDGTVRLLPGAGAGACALEHGAWVRDRGPWRAGQETAVAGEGVDWPRAAWPGLGNAALLHLIQGHDKAAQGALPPLRHPSRSPRPWDPTTTL